MPNFEKNLEEATETELRSWINTRNPHYTQLASEELTRRELKDLSKNMKESSKASGYFTEVMFVVALLQLMVAAFQFTEFSWWVRVIIWAILAGILVLIVKKWIIPAAKKK